MAAPAGTMKSSKSSEEKMNLEELGLKAGWSGHYNPTHFAAPLKALTFWTGTVFMDAGIWRICGCLVLLAFTIAGLCNLLIKDAHNLESNSMDTLLKYLKVFLAFMLGMFMNNSLGRWWTTVNALTDYFNNIEKLLYCCNAFGLAQHRRKEIIGYCIASCHCLNAEVTTSFYKDEHEVEKLWSRLFNMLLEKGWVDDQRIEMLCQVRAPERAGCCWSFISGSLAVMFEKEQAIKPPAMNRLVLQCQIAVDMVSQLKVQICIQMPFMYAHMMACLVHVNNILVSVSCGFGLGAHVGKLIHHVGQGRVGDAVGPVQGIGLVLVTLLVEPMLYQAFLQIGTNFCYPFGKEWHHIPLTRMIKDLEVNCTQMNLIADSKIRPEAPKADAGLGFFLATAPSASSPRPKALAAAGKSGSKLDDGDDGD